MSSLKNIQLRRQLESTFRELIEQKVLVNNDCTLQFNLNLEPFQKLIKYYQNAELPQIKRLELLRINKFHKPDIIKRFIETSIIYNLQGFKIHSYDGLTHAQCQLYKPIFEGIAPKIDKYIQIDYFYFDLSEFKYILNLFMHLEVVKFYKGHFINFENYHFYYQVKESKTKVLEFNGCGEQRYSDWENHFEYFEQFIKAISMLPDLKQSLQTIILRDGNVTAQQAMNVLNDLDMGHINANLQ